MSEIRSSGPSIPLRRGGRSNGRGHLIRSLSPFTMFGGDRDHPSSSVATGSRNDRRSAMMMAMMKYSSSRNSISTTHRTSTNTSSTTHQPMHGQSHVAKFHIHEITRGRRIPADQTTEMYEIVNVKQDHRERLDFEQHARDAFCNAIRDIRAGTYGSKKSKKGFVIKHIQKDCMECHSDFESSATSLESEASLLKNLSHPSIQRLRGESIGMAEAYYQMGRYDAFFLILDRVEETLVQRIRKWRTRYQRFKWQSLNGSIRKKKTRRFLVERLLVVSEIADAVKYMHDHDICHGNIRHDQIGFDGSNDVKVCGFHSAGRAICLRKGFCDNCRPPSVDLFAEVHNSETVPDDSIEISCEISPLANACESIDGKFRCLKQDVFDFSQLFCEAISMKTSSEANKVCSRSSRGVQGYVRDFQTITSPIPRCLLEMIQSGLSKNVCGRPTMADYCICLSEVVDTLMNDQPTEISATGKSISSQHHRMSFKRCFQRRRTMFSLSEEGMVESKALSLSCGINDEGRNDDDAREDQLRRETHEEVTERTDITS